MWMVKKVGLLVYFIIIIKLKGDIMDRERKRERGREGGENKTI